MLIVEDEPLLGSLLEQALVAQNFQVRVVGNVQDARVEVRNFDPDGILLDILLGDGPSGLDLAYVLSTQRPDIAIIFLTRYSDPFAAGINGLGLPNGFGFLRKDRVRDTDYLLASINAVMTDRPREARHDLDEPTALSALSPKHVEVLRLMALGFTNERISQVRGVAQSTVERWTAEIFRDLGIDTKGDVNPRVEAVRRFIAAAGIPARR